MGDNRGVVVGSGRLTRGWRVAGDGGNTLSGEPHLGCSGAVQHFLGVRIDELSVEETSGGESQLPREVVIRDERHRVKIW